MELAASKLWMSTKFEVEGVEAARKSREKPAEGEGDDAGASSHRFPSATRKIVVMDGADREAEPRLHEQQHEDRG